jgi:hypothetical protein
MRLFLLIPMILIGTTYGGYAVGFGFGMILRLLAPQNDVIRVVSGLCFIPGGIIGLGVGIFLSSMYAERTHRSRYGHRPRRAFLIFSALGLVMSLGLWPASTLNIQYVRPETRHPDLTVRLISLVNGQIVFGYDGVNSLEEWGGPGFRTQCTNYHNYGYPFLGHPLGRDNSVVKDVIEVWLPLWVPAAFFAVILSFCHPFETIRRLRRSHLGLCAHCGYDLRGSPEGACSECGADTALAG